MPRYTALSLFFLTYPVMAEQSIAFKKELINTYPLFPYVLVSIVLLLALFIMAPYLKRRTITHRQCKVTEKMAISHKTKIYILDYQGQKFLLADNNHSLAMHPLQENSSS